MNFSRLHRTNKNGLSKSVYPFPDKKQIKTALKQILAECYLQKTHDSVPSNLQLPHACII